MIHSKLQEPTFKVLFYFHLIVAQKDLTEVSY